MKTSFPKTQHIRFTVDTAAMKNVIRASKLTYNNTIKTSAGFDQSYARYYLLLEFTVTYFLPGNKTEVVKYRGENAVLIFEVKNEVSDLQALKQLVTDAYVTVALFLIEKLPHGLRHATLPQSMIDEAAHIMLQLLHECGYYREFD